MTAKKVLIIEARFYDHIADMLLDGAVQCLKDHNIEYDLLNVPGALEIPMALSYAAQSEIYDGVIVLGCVIRGETGHYDVVVNESARGIYAVSLAHNIPLGNAILTVENNDQAIERADPKKKNKGRDAVMACLNLMKVRSHYA